MSSYYGSNKPKTYVTFNILSNVYVFTDPWDSDYEAYIKKHVMNEFVSNTLQ